MTADRGLLVVISGPSGVGKGAVMDGLQSALPDAQLSISVTTRPPRPGEEPGVDYVFVSDEEFDRLEADGELLEHASYAGHRYGTPGAFVEEGIAAGTTVLLEIDVEGAIQVRDRVAGALLIFVLPPSLAELERRLARRGTEDAAGRAKRLEMAREEMDRRHLFDEVVVNDDLDACVQEIAGIVAAARAPA